MYEILGKRVIITGSESMVGKVVSKEIARLGGYVYRLPHSHFDLTDWQQTNNAFSDIRGDVLIHLAAYNGNIEFNKKYPFDIYYRTAQIGLNCLKAAAENGVKKIVSLISSCAYPDLGNQTLKEKDFWLGEPNKSVSAHGYAKRSILEFGQQIKKQFDIDCIGVVVNTIYGPNDSYDENKTKVVGSLIKKFTEAKKNNSDFIELWGTGEARREFIYCEDVARYLPLAIRDYENSEYPINIGSGTDYTIKELAEIVKLVVGFKGNIKWNNGPDGQMKKLLDNTRMKQLWGELDFVPLGPGITQTVEWYNAQYNSSNN